MSDEVLWCVTTLDASQSSVPCHAHTCTADSNITSSHNTLKQCSHTWRDTNSCNNNPSRNCLSPMFLPGIDSNSTTNPSPIASLHLDRSPLHLPSSSSILPICPQKPCCVCSHHASLSTDTATAPAATCLPSSACRSSSRSDTCFLKTPLV